MHENIFGNVRKHILFFKRLYANLTQNGKTFELPRISHLTQLSLQYSSIYRIALQFSTWT